MKFALRAVFASAIGLLSACGPVYQTDYAYRPPASPEGRSCIFQCETVRQQCRQLEEMKQANCENRSYWENEYCEEHIRRTKNREPKWYECGGSSCSADYDHCEVTYRHCYQSCGGEVQANTYCVSGCEKIPPKPQY